MEVSKGHEVLAQQKDETILYWDKFYTDLDKREDSIDQNATADKNDVEWIVSDKPVVLDKILSLFPPQQSSMKMLEIGCGVSKLSRSLLERTIERKHDSQQYEFVSTDVSLVCLEHNRARDASYIASLPDSSSLSYMELNAIKQLPPSQLQKYDVVLDKGTCDTFLFRSKRTQKASATHPPLLKSLLNNIHRLLQSGCKAKYIIISPRSKLKSIRDFNGFTSVNRTKMSADLLGNAVLVKGNSDHKPAHVYIYECFRNDYYNPDSDEPFGDDGLEEVNDETICEKCGLSFKIFLGNVDIQDQGAVQWTRRFRNHIIHCKRN